MVIFAMRLMGKRQIGDMQPSELVVTIMISELAAMPMQGTHIPLIAGILPIMTLVVAEIMVSYSAMISPKFRRVISGQPSVVVRDGKIVYEEMEKNRISIDDLMEELRLANCPKVKDVKRAIIETNGKLSVEQKGN